MTAAPPGWPEGERGPSREDAGTLAYYRQVAPYMDREPRAAGERAFWAEEFARAGRAARAVDVGCGTGALTRLLARSAVRTIGVDLSSDMLQLARRRTAGHTGIRLVRGDVRSLPLAGGWDLAVAAGGLFGHLLEDGHRDRALAEIARILRRGGLLLLDGLWMPGPDFRRACREGLFRERPLEHPSGPPAPVVREEWHCRAGSRICRARYRYGPADGPAHTSAAFTARVWEEGEIRQRLEAAGLALETRWGDFERGPWNPSASPRLLLRARAR